MIVIFLFFIFNYLLFYDHFTYKNILYFNHNTAEKITVIIPAKNEEEKIGQLLKSLVSKYIDEIIVVNDLSDDNTENEVKKFKHVKLINISNKPKGYTGKNYALLQGYKHSKNKNLLFLDADTYVSNDINFDKILLDFLNNNDKVYSALPYYQTKNYVEKLSCIFCIIVSMAFTKFNFNNSLHGSCILISKDLYEKIGTHFVIKNEVVEDMALANLLKQNNIKIKRFLGRNIISFRMYTNLNNIIEGWSKNIAKGFKHNSIINTIAIVLFICSIFAVLYHCVELILYGQVLYSILLYTLLSFVVYMYSYRIISINLFESLGIGFYIIFFLAIFLYSTYLTLLKRKVKWKGNDIFLNN